VRILTSSGRLSTADIKVTVPAAPDGSGLEVVICVDYRDQTEDESDGEEREPGGPGRGWGHNIARSAVKRGPGYRRGFCSVRRVEWSCATERERAGEMSVEAGGQ